MQTYLFGPKKGQPIPARTDVELYHFHQNCQRTVDSGGFTPISKFAKLTGRSTTELRQIAEEMYELATRRYGRHGWIATRRASCEIDIYPCRTPEEAQTAGVEGLAYLDSLDAGGPAPHWLDEVDARLGANL